VKVAGAVKKKFEAKEKALATLATGKDEASVEYEDRVWLAADVNPSARKAAGSGRKCFEVAGRRCKPNGTLVGGVRRWRDREDEGRIAIEIEIGREQRSRGGREDS